MSQTTHSELTALRKQIYDLATWTLILYGATAVLVGLTFAFPQLAGDATYISSQVACAGLPALLTVFLALSTAVKCGTVAIRRRRFAWALAFAVLVALVLAGPTTVALSASNLASFPLTPRQMATLVYLSPLATVVIPVSGLLFAARALRSRPSPSADVQSA